MYLLCEISFNQLANEATAKLTYGYESYVEMLTTQLS